MPKLLPDFLTDRTRKYFSLLYRNSLQTPIIVFQPGKVGSRTVEKSLIEAYDGLKTRAEIYHAHALNNLDEREEFIRKNRKNPTDSIEVVKKWRQLGEQIKTDPKRIWNVINLVRDPVAMKVSALFTTLYQHIPDWKKRLRNNNLTMADLDELFFSKTEFRFGGLDKWYDTQINELWGIDVYAYPFPTQNGYRIYQTANINLMIIRLEDLNRVAEKAFDEFLGLKNFKVVSVNISENKPYAKLYNEFKSRPLPAEYVNKAYNGRYARHFYADEELQAFRKKWLKL